MTECHGNNFMMNGELQPTEIFDNSMVYEGESVYEVIRVVKALPLFFYDHVGRLETSARLQGKMMLADAETLRESIILLLKTEKARDVNLKIVFNYKKEGSDWLIYFIEPLYPTAEQYRKGVRGVLFHAERKDPVSKVINHKLRSEIYHKLILDGAYEALLVDHNGCITEGSRSNVFFIKGDTLYTAPEEAVLNGITRKHIIEICRENGLPVEFTCIKEENISEFSSAIMTGTSPVVLPFYIIDNTYFSVSHHLIALLRNLYYVKAEESRKIFAG
jgi:branched-chain amino acid aminotransferase